MKVYLTFARKYTLA